MILSDDAGYNELGFANAIVGSPNSHAVTPNLDAIAADGVVMRQGYVAASLCTVSRAGLLLGQYQQRFGMDENISTNNISATFGLPAGQPTIASQLKSLGYSTSAFGKWHLGTTAGVNRPLNVGFDEFTGYIGGDRSYFIGDGNPAQQLRHTDANSDVVIEATAGNAQNGNYSINFLGDQASQYIRSNASAVKPFFMYTAFGAPHSPWAGGPNGNGTTNEDFNQPQIAQITDPWDRITAALIHGMDRNVGKMVSALKDPNGDGNTSDSVYDNTIIVYMNDNGGVFLNEAGNPHTMNVPFNGFKGYTLEGGIRVPFFMKTTGDARGVFDAPVSAYDMLPTFVSAAGGTLPQDLNRPGVDIMPYINEEVAGNPHDGQYIFWRMRNYWAVRKGDYKYCRPLDSNFAWPYLFNLANSTQETQAQNLVNIEPAVAAELKRAFTNFESTVAKPLYGVLGTDDRNKFDHFVFRNDVAPTTTWSTASAWQEYGTANNRTFKVDDAYANAILEFTTKNDSDYTATNDMARMSGLTFMLNQLWFTGNFTGAVNRTATINSGGLSFAVNGNNSITSAQDLLLVKDLNGQLPRLQLDATASGTPANFRFQVSHNLELHDDLLITGNGTQDFTFTGAIRDFFEPRNVLKIGTSRITLQGASTFHGNLTVNAGEVRLTGAAVSLNGPSNIILGNGGTLRLEQGTVTVPTLDTSAGGQFVMTGGRFSTSSVIGNLNITGGTFAPGGTPSLSSISGNFTQTAGGKLELDLGGVAPGLHFDQIAVGGTTTLGGTLEVKLLAGYTPATGAKFEIIDSNLVQGSFASYVLPSLGSGKFWSVQNTGSSVFLLVGLPGDYNGDNLVNAADYTLWRNTKGQTVAAGIGADGNRDGQITVADLVVWKNNYGAVRIAGSGAGTGSAVPEPSAIVLFGLMSAAVAAVHRRRRQ